MKKILIAAAAFASLATASYAADLPAGMPMKAAVPLPVTTWTGCYVGAGGGYGMWNQENQVFDGPIAIGPIVTAGGRGWFGTAQVGCDYQVSSSFVIGAFGDYDFSALKGIPSYGVLGVSNFGEEKQKWAWSAGARVGYLVLPQLLTYVSGGYTQAHFDGVTLFDTTTGLASGFRVNEQTYSGWFLGSGYEYGISFLPGLFWKTEYRFAQYRVETNPIIISATGAQLAGLAGGISVDSEKWVQTIRSELVWRFNFAR